MSLPYSSSLRALYSILAFFIGMSIFRIATVILHAGVASFLAMMAESPKSVYGNFPKLVESFSIEYPLGVEAIYQKLHSNRPPSYYDLSVPVEPSLSLEAPFQKRNSKDRWAFILYVIASAGYLFCCGK